MERKLATIRIIDKIEPINGADNIEVATIDGWEVVVKKDEFNVGSPCIYIEIDSWVPTEIAPFLSKGKNIKTYNSIPGERLKTARLRGQLSQGLVLNYWDYPSVVEEFHKTRLSSDGYFDVTSLLNIQKWEAPIAANLDGVVKGNFPSYIPKTDQERVQNMTKTFSNLETNLRWEVSEKLDGSSMTVYLKDNEFGVCSRNLDLKIDENNTFCKIFIANNIEEFLRSKGGNYAIQGEIIGEGIQKNPYGLKGQNFYVFDVYNIDRMVYLNSFDRMEFINGMLNHVPIVNSLTYIEYDSKVLLEKSEIKSILNPKVNVEGLVYKCFEKPYISFKAISNSWLLKNEGK